MLPIIRIRHDFISMDAPRDFICLFGEVPVKYQLDRVAWLMDANVLSLSAIAVNIVVETSIRNKYPAVFTGGMSTFGDLVINSIRVAGTTAAANLLCHVRRSNDGLLVTISETVLHTTLSSMIKDSISSIVNFVSLL